jgi:VWFA-related protein
MVLADVQVINAKTGVPAQKLASEDFRIFEDGVEQNIAQVWRDELPLSAVLLFDLTASVRGVLNHLAEGATAALAHFKPGDEVAVMAYGQTARLVDGFSTDRGATVRAIRATAAMRTNEFAYFNEAVYQADQQLKATAPSHRRVIIWLTDNYPNVPFRHPVHTEAEAIHALNNDGVAVAPILMKDILALPMALGASMTEKHWVKDYPPGDANKYAELTGGRSMGLRGKNADERLAELIDQLRSRYTVGYRPAQAKPSGTFCKLRVELSPESGLRPKEWVVLARAGYYSK